MAAPTNYFVDPLNGSDTTGDGSLGNPWKTPAKAMAGPGSGITRDAANGDQVNVRDTAVVNLTSPVSASAYGLATFTAPLKWRGYSNVANDGGTATMIGDGVPVFSEAAQHIMVWQDMILSVTSPAANVIDLALVANSGLDFINCEVSGGSAALVQQRGNTRYFGCYLHDFVLAWYGVAASGGNAYIGNYLKNSTWRSSHNNPCPGCWQYNILEATGIFGYQDQIVTNNIFWGKGVSGYGFSPRNDGTGRHILLNNIFADFNGVGQVGISMTNSVQYIEMLGFNKFYNCTTNIGSAGYILNNLGNNDTLSEHPLIDPANGDFRLIDSDELKGLAFPTSFKGTITNNFLDPGAAQREEAGGLAGPIIGSGIIL